MRSSFIYRRFRSGVTIVLTLGRGTMKKKNKNLTDRCFFQISDSVRNPADQTTRRTRLVLYTFRATVFQTRNKRSDRARLYRPSRRTRETVPRTTRSSEWRATASDDVLSAWRRDKGRTDVRARRCLPSGRVFAWNNIRQNGHDERDAPRKRVAGARPEVRGVTSRYPGPAGQRKHR